MTRTQNYYDGENYFTVKDSIRVDSEFIEAFLEWVTKCLEVSSKRLPSNEQLPVPSLL